MIRRIGLLSVVIAIAAAGGGAALAGNPVPLQLPRPDGKPGDMTKPVKVYILAGQSNMVGMGDITGAQPPYPTVFLSADPAILPGPMPVGKGGLARHEIFQSEAPDAPRGARASVYPGAYDARTDYSKLQPVKTTVVALGTFGESLPAIEGPHTVVARAAIEVPENGVYTVRAGFEESSHAVVLLDGREVYRKEIGGRPAVEKVTLEKGRRYPIAITYFRGGSAAFWLQQVDIEGRGDLVTLTKKEGKFPYLLDEAGNWSARSDVVYVDPRLFPNRPPSLLSATSNNGKSIGPEVGFGYVMGHFHDEPVLLIKTAMGNRSLGFDFRPPSSGRTAPDNQFESLEYQLMLKGVRETLERIEQIVPGYQGQGYEIVGFAWWQGHKDSGSTKEEYEKHLVNLIDDLRRDLQAPNMKVVVASVGFHGYRLARGPWQGVWEAQMAVGDPAQHPRFAGNVASVDTRDFWREVEESPRNQDYHYNRNPETYLLVGEAMGRAMARLLGGQAEPIPKSDREAKTLARMAEEAARPQPTEEQRAAHRIAIKPIVLDGALAAFLNDPRNRPLLEAAFRGERPAKAAPYLNDILDEVADYYRAVGIRDYDWRGFGEDLREAEWDYFCFNSPNPDLRTKGIRDLAEIHPAGMENWFAPDFDAKRAGWSRGRAPFGADKDPMAFANPDWYNGPPRSPAATVCDKDILLLRRQQVLPPLKEGYRYRIRVFGSVRHNCGEGFAIFVNGRLLSESKAGVVGWRREGGLPRGGHIWADYREEFKGGPATIAAANFPMDNWAKDRFVPARGPLSVWIEEQQLPPIE